MNDSRGAEMTTRKPGRLAAEAIAAATPAGRDRLVDFLRAFSIAVVVFGHWLMAAVTVRGGNFTAGNALDVIPGLWMLTWVLQVMPVFFFVGGFSNLVSWRSGERKGATYAEFLRSRIERLMRPTIVFVAIWLVSAGALSRASGAVASDLKPALGVIAKPLWFLGVYVLVVALSPVMIRLHIRHGTRIPVMLGLAALVVDVARVGLTVPGIGYLNYAFVWLFAHQLGFFYAEGTLVSMKRRTHVATAVASLGTLVALTLFGPYSPSMVGMATHKASNNSPPSICLIALTMFLVALTMIVREPVGRRLQRPRAWAAVVAANSMIMTVFLWHLTALLIGAVALAPLGFLRPEIGSTDWWALRPVWIVVLALLLVPFVMAFGRFERSSEGLPTPRSIAPVQLGTAVIMLIAGLSLLAQFGFDFEAVPSPWFSGVLAVAGYGLSRGTERRPAAR